MKKIRLRTVLLVLAALVALGLCLTAGLSLWVLGSARPYILPPAAAASQPADCILVLGCGVRPDGTPSLMLRDRLDMGLRLYELGAAPKLLMSGDHGTVEYDEVGTMKDYAVARSVPAGDVFEDHAGFSTYESMYRARDVFAVKKVLIVSQRYHLSRAVYDARALGLDAWGVPAEEISYLGQFARSAREVLARCKDALYCIAKPEPTFLGEIIPITGDGSLTEG